ncbi:ABC transporter permease [Acidobacteriota bacterium]
MLLNYIKIAFRNLQRQKIYSFISMSSLALGLGFFIMFALMSNFFSSFDNFHDKANRIFGVVQVLSGGADGEQHSAITPTPLAETLVSEFPEIEKATRYFPPGRMVVTYQDKIFYETGIRFVDSSFLSVFSFPLKKGDSETVLSKPYSVLLTEETASKYFDNEDPLGKILTLDNSIEVTVTGVTDNVPKNSTLNYDFLISMETAKNLSHWTEDWKVNNQALFLLLSEGSDPSSLESKLPLVIDKYYPVSKDSPTKIYLFPLLDIFLKSFEIDSYWGSGQISFLFWIIPILLLFVACINFMNLSTARYVMRAKEVGLRKVIGAQRFQLIKQFIGEAVILTFLSLPIAIVLFEFIHPLFSVITGDSIDFNIWNKPHILGFILIVTFLTGLIAGSYPAFYLSVFKPIKVLKGNIQVGKKGGRLRKTLVVVQFTFSIILIVMTVVSIKQLDFNFKVDLGFNRAQIVAVEIAGKARKNLENLKQELKKDKDIVAVSASVGLPVSWETNRRVFPEGSSDDESINMNTYGIDHEFIELLDLKITEGRSFSPLFNDTGNYIINETAVRHLNWESPLGKQLTVGDNKGTVIGVASDFHFQSLYLTGMMPSVLYLDSENVNYMYIKYTSPDKFSGVLLSIEELWKVFAPDLPFEYVLLNDHFEDVYRSGDKTAQMSALIGGIAIFLSCLGLFGLSSFAVERRKKEIGIRKILGASVAKIIRMLVKEFIFLIVVANFIALPISYFLMQSMIQFLYAYPMKMGAMIFLLTAAITLFIAFITVISLTLKAAFSNPIDSLRYE